MGMLQLSSSSYGSVDGLPSFLQTLCFLFLFTGSYSSNQDRPFWRAMTATRVTRLERRERPEMAVGNDLRSLSSSYWTGCFIKHLELFDEIEPPRRMEFLRESMESSLI